MGREVYDYDDDGTPDLTINETNHNLEFYYNPNDFNQVSNFSLLKVSIFWKQLMLKSNDSLNTSPPLLYI